MRQAGQANTSADRGGKLWKPEELWELPPNPYVNHTPPLSYYELAKWSVVGLTLFVPRLLGVILTGALRTGSLYFSSGGAPWNSFTTHTTALTTAALPVSVVISFVTAKLTVINWPVGEAMRVRTRALGSSSAWLVAGVPGTRFHRCSHAACPCFPAACCSHV